jgi:hypothetical protein
MTLPLPHLLQRSLLTKLAIGASAFNPERASDAGPIVLRWRQLMQRTVIVPAPAATEGGILRPPY